MKKCRDFYILNCIIKILITTIEMTTEVYDEIEIEDLDFDAESATFFYPCPCGDKFQITL